MLYKVLPDSEWFLYIYIIIWEVFDIFSHRFLQEVFLYIARWYCPTSYDVIFDLNNNNILNITWLLNGQYTKIFALIQNVYIFAIWSICLPQIQYREKWILAKKLCIVIILLIVIPIKRDISGIYLNGKKLCEAKQCRSIRAIITVFLSSKLRNTQ